MQAYEYLIVQWADPTDRFDPDAFRAHVWRVWSPGAVPDVAEDPDGAPEVYRLRLFGQLGRQGWQLVEGVVTVESTTARGGVREATTR